MSDRMGELAKLRASREVMISYMIDKMQGQDWHGVMDAAADLREIDAKIEVFRDHLEPRE